MKEESLKDRNQYDNSIEDVTFEQFINSETIHVFTKEYEEKKKQHIEKIGHQNVANDLGSGSGRITDRRGKRIEWTRRNVLIAAAAALIIAVPGTAFAAKQIIHGIEAKKQQTANYEYGYSFDEGQQSELYHTPVKMNVTYLPEGYEGISGSETKFDLNGKTTSKKGFSIALLGFTKESDLQINNAVTTQDMTIGGKEATLFYRNVLSESGFDKVLIVFFNEYGYGVQLYGQKGLTEEELIKVAEGVALDPCTEEEKTYVGYVQSEEDRKAAEKAALGYGAAAIQSASAIDDGGFHEIGETFKGVSTKTSALSRNIEYTVVNYEVKDTIEGMSQSGFGHDLDTVKELLNEDGSLKQYEKQTIEAGDGVNTISTVTHTESKNLKFVYVTMRAKNTSTQDLKEINIVPQMCCLSVKDNSLEIPGTLGVNTTEAINPEGWSVYCDQPSMYQELPEQYSGRIQFYEQRYEVKAGEELEYHVMYVVEEDQMNHMVLFFNGGSGSDIDIDLYNRGSSFQQIVRLY